MRGLVAELKTYHYELQPGDATRYTFSLTFPEIGGSFASRGFDDVEAINITNRLLDAPLYFVQIAIRMSFWQGIYSSSFGALKDLKSHHIRYLASHMNVAASHSSQIYAIAAVCLAASVLIDDPLAVGAACKEMLKVPELLK